MPRATMSPPGGNPFWTPLVRNVILTLFGVYVVQLVVGWQVVLALFALAPLGGGLMPWQPFSFTFVGAEPGGMLWQFVGVFFFLQPVVDTLGRRRFWWSTLFVWGFALVVKLGAEALGVLAPTPTFGFAWWVDALVAWFGFSNRGQPVRMMFFLPMRAEMLAWIAGILSLLYVLFSRDTASLHMLAAFVGAWIILHLEPGALRRLRLRLKKAKIERQLSRFEVIDGGKEGAAGERPRRGDPKDWVN